MCFGEDLDVGLAAFFGAGAYEEGEMAHHVEQNFGSSEGLDDAVERGAELATFIFIGTIGSFYALGVIVPLSGVRERGADGAVACLVSLAHNGDDIVGEGLRDFTLVGSHLVVCFTEILVLVLELNNADGQAITIHHDIQAVGTFARANGDLLCRQVGVLGGVCGDDVQVADTLGSVGCLHFHWDAGAHVAESFLVLSHDVGAAAAGQGGVGLLHVVFGGVRVEAAQGFLDLAGNEQ